MSNIRIKNIVIYIFLTLVIGIAINSGILYISLSKLYNLNKSIMLITDTKNSFLEVKLETERLLTTRDLDKSKHAWFDSINKFEKDMKLLSDEHQSIFENSWYICKKEIEDIKVLLKNEMLLPHDLEEKSISMLKGQMFALNENTEQYRLINSLINKIGFLMQYETFIFDDFNSMQNYHKTNIDAQISTTIMNTIYSIVTIVVLMLVMIYILNKKILKIEDKLIKSKKEVSDNLVKLENAKLLLQNVIDSVPVSLFWKDTDGKYMGLNKTFLTSNTEFSDIKDVIGKTDFEMPWKDTEAKAYREDDLEVINSGKSKLQIEETLTKDNGEQIFVITSKVPLKDTAGKIIGSLGVFMDITETKQMYNELAFKDKLLAQQSKMAAMGEMLENIAHQWRQPLSLISSSSSGLGVKKEYDLLDDEYFFDALKNIQESVEFMDQTIEDFRNYFKEDKEFNFFKLKNEVDKALFLANSKIKNRAINIVKDLPEVEAYGLENEFIQVIMNIINNAIDVLDEKKIADKVILIESKDMQTHVELSICDNGGGIPENIIASVFDPYFTTKGPKKGTGIGLYMSKDMVEKHMHGKISVVNNDFAVEGKNYTGAKFIIELPNSAKQEGIV